MTENQNEIKLTEKEILALAESTVQVKSTIELVNNIINFTKPPRDENVKRDPYLSYNVLYSALQDIYESNNHLISKLDSIGFKLYNAFEEKELESYNKSKKGD